VILTLTYSITRAWTVLGRAVVDEAGQGLSEYALILAFVAIVAIAALTLLGADITSVLSSVANTF
jgi:Flp pilus assembly pilin Flp